MATILVTGAAGLLGKQFVLTASKTHRIIAADVRPLPYTIDPERVTACRFDLRDYGAIFEVFRQYEVDVVMHSGAISHPGYSLSRPLETVQVNFDATVALLEAARILGVKKFIFISTGNVYGPYLSPTVDENHPLPGHSPYGVSKVAAELMGRMYSREYGMNFITLRVNSIYGSDRHEPSLMKTLVEAAAANKPIELSRGADTWVSTIYQADVSQPILTCIDRDISNETFNINDGPPHRIGDVADLLKTLRPSWHVRLGPGPKDPSKLPSTVREYPDAVLSTEKAKKHLNFAPAYTIERGVKEWLSNLKVP